MASSSTARPETEHESEAANIEIETEFREMNEQISKNTDIST